MNVGRIILRNQIEEQLGAGGLSPVLAEIRARRPSPDLWPDLLRAAFWRSCLEAAQRREPGIASFDGRLHDRVVEEFTDFDRERLAVTSLLRGRQAVIAGDARQLPPTTFFAAGVGDDEADDEHAEGTGGFESLLDVMSAFLDPPWSLDWHYRSRDESLIAFSNHHIYGGRLVTFPGPGGESALRWVEVPHEPGERASQESAGREVQRVVELVIEHARTRPHETLGVIAMGLKHADRVEMVLDEARRNEPQLDAFFAADRAERFFVKNLERVQGDERDAIILTIGYGKDETGRLRHRFGPLLQEGRERRLNVAVTRARRRLTLVSSFSHLDMHADSPREGVRLLRAYLEYAASGGVRLDGGRATAVPLNDFDQYSRHELDAIVRWVHSDGLLHTREEVIDDVRQALGFSRRGSRIVAAIEAAIDRVGREPA